MEILALILVVVALVIAQSVIFKKFSLKNLEYRCYLSKSEVFEGDEIELVEEVVNRKFLPIPWLKTEITTSRWLEFAGSQSFVSEETRFVPSFFSLKGYQKVVRRWKVKCLKRGDFSIHKVVLVSADLLGRSSFSQGVELNSSILVLPRTCDLQTAFFSPRYLQGDHIVRRQLVDDPFYISGVREYQEGDTLNRIHWSATAKMQHLMVRNFDYTSRQSVSVLLNVQSRERERGKVIDAPLIENAIRVSASLIEQSLTQNIPVGFACNACIAGHNDPLFFPESFGTEYYYVLLRQLALLELHSTDDFGVYLSYVSEQIRSTDLAIVTAYLSDSIFHFARLKQQEGVQVRIYYVGIEPPSLPEDLEIYCLFETLKKFLQAS